MTGGPETMPIILKVLYLCLCLSLSNPYRSSTYKLKINKIYYKFISISNISDTYKLCLYGH